MQLYTKTVNLENISSPACSNHVTCTEVHTAINGLTYQGFEKYDSALLQQSSHSCLHFVDMTLSTAVIVLVCGARTLAQVFLSDEKHKTCFSHLQVPLLYKQSIEVLLLRSSNFQSQLLAGPQPLHGEKTVPTSAFS